MNNHLNDVLYDTAEQIFENLAFVLTMPEGDVFGDISAELDSDDDSDSPPESASENGTFVTARSLASQNGDSEEETVVASIHFSGHFDGDLFIEASTDVLPVIGMNMLGLDDEDALSAEEQKDAFTELLNVVCGNLLPAMAGVRAVFNIEHAEMYPDATIPKTFDGRKPMAHAHFGLEVGYAKLALFVDDKAREDCESNLQECVNNG